MVLEPNYMAFFGGFGHVLGVRDEILMSKWGFKVMGEFFKD